MINTSFFHLFYQLDAVPLSRYSVPVHFNTRRFFDIPTNPDCLTKRNTSQSKAPQHCFGLMSFVLFHYSEERRCFRDYRSRLYHIGYDKCNIYWDLHNLGKIVGIALVCVRSFKIELESDRAKKKLVHVIFFCSVDFNNLFKFNLFHFFFFCNRP